VEVQAATALFLSTIRASGRSMLAWG